MKQQIAALIVALASCLASGVFAQDVTQDPADKPPYRIVQNNWRLVGHYDFEDPDNRVCVLRLDYQNGAVFKINIFPKADGRRNLSVSYHNPDLDFMAVPLEAIYATMTFRSKGKEPVQYTDRPAMDWDEVKEWQILKDPHTLVFKNDIDKYLHYFADYEYLHILETDEFPEFKNHTRRIKLQGVAPFITKYIDDCVDAVLNYEIPG